MPARQFWSGVWAELTGAGEQRRTAAALRVQHFNEAADVLDSIARTLDCFDDAASKQQAQETLSCARALRIHVTGTSLTNTPEA